MSINAKVGSFTGSGVTGNQSITGLGFQPKVVIFYFNMSTADGSGNDAVFGFGVGISSSDRRCSGNYSSHNVTPSSNQAWNQNTYCIYTPSGTQRADFVSMDADGFTINWLGASSMIVNYLALGGSGLANFKTGVATAKLTTGNQAYTGVGFQPTCLITFAGKFSTEPLDQSTQGNAFFGVASGPTSRGLMAWRNQNNSNPQVAKRRQSSQRVASTATDFTEADFVSFDADGFTLNFTRAGGAADIFYYLVLRGPRAKVINFNQPIATGNQALTGAGFQPKAAIILSGNSISASNDAVQSNARASLGMATSSTQRGCMWTGETDAVSPTVAQRNLDRTKAIKLMSSGTPTVDAAADHVSFDADGQTLNWSTVDATARELSVLWLGDESSGATQTISGAGNIASAEAFGTPKVNVVQIIAPTGIVSAQAFGSPVVSLAPTSARALVLNGFNQNAKVTLPNAAPFNSLGAFKMVFRAHALGTTTGRFLRVTDKLSIVGGADADPRRLDFNDDTNSVGMFHPPTAWSDVVGKLQFDPARTRWTFETWLADGTGRIERLVGLPSIANLNFGGKQLIFGSNEFDVSWFAYKLDWFYMQAGADLLDVFPGAEITSGATYLRYSFDSDNGNDSSGNGLHLNLLGNPSFENTPAVSTGTTPAAPSNLNLNAVSSSQVDLTWIDNANNETSFRIERKTGVGGSYAEVGSNVADDVTFSDATVSAGTLYFYRVRARNAAGDSAYLTEQSVTTPAASLGVNVKTGSFLLNTVTGNQSITGLGFQPKVVIFYWQQETADGNADNAVMGIGVGISSSDRRATMNIAMHNVTPSQNVTAQQNTRCIYHAGGSPQADFVTTDVDGFTINITNAGAARVINFLALGGNDLTNYKTMPVAAPTVAGNQAYTGLGFQPTCLIFFTGKWSQPEPFDLNANGAWFFGIATAATERASIAWRSRNNANPSVTKHRQSVNRVALSLNDTALFAEADLISFDADGFTLSFATSSGAADVFYCLALRGPQFRLKTFNQPLATGNQALTGAGFQPKAALLFSANDTAANNDQTLNDANVSLGTVTGATARGAIWSGATHNVSPTVAKQNLDRTKVLKMIAVGATPTVNAAADHASFDGDGQTLNWSIADAIARQFSVLWIGDTTGGTTPAAPSNLILSAVSATQVDLSWTDNSTNETSFRIERKTGAGGAYAEIGFNAAGDTTFSDLTTGPNTTYFYRVRARNSVGDSAYLAEQSITTPAGGTTPTAPSNLILSAPSGTQVDLSWTDNSTNESSFRVERKTGAGGTYAEIGSTVTDDNTFSDVTAVPGVTYFYRVRARNAIGDSAFLAEQSITTPTGPNAPSTLVVTALSERLVMLVWTDNSTNETSFRVERKTGVGGAYAEIGSVGPNIISFYDRTAVAGTTYFYRVRARNANGDSSFLTEQSVSMPTAGTTLAMWTANLQSGNNTAGVANYANQVALLAPGTDAIAVQERADGANPWASSLTAAGFVELIYRKNGTGQPDGSAIWVRSAAVTLVTPYQTDLSQGAIGWGGTNVDKAAVAVKVTYAGKTFILISVHLAWSAGADTQNSLWSAIRVAQLREMLRWIASTIVPGSIPLFIIGDMNLTRTMPRAPEFVFTAASGTDVITLNNHPYVNGTVVMVRNEGGALPGNLAPTTRYYVRDVTTNTFKLAASAGGAAIDLTSNGTGTQFITALDSDSSFTADPNTDVITVNHVHGWPNGAPVVVRNVGGALPGNLFPDTVYYARDVGSNTLRLAATRGGAAINLTSAGTGSNFIAATQFGLLVEAGYSDVFERALNAGHASAPWGDRDGNGIPDMPLSIYTTRTHDTRPIDHAVDNENMIDFVLRYVTIPDWRESCPHALVPGGNYPQCTPEVATLDDTPDDMGVKMTDHNPWLMTYDVVASSPPNAPSNLIATPVSATQVDLAWVDNSDNETTFRVERKTGAGGVYAEIGFVNANVTTFSDITAAASTTYFYRVRARNAIGDSAFLPEQSVTTPASGTTPNAPTNLLLIVVSQSQIDLSWTDNSTNETSFRIERKTGAAGAYAEIGFNAAGDTTYSDLTASPGTTYFYRVKARNDFGDSAYLPEQSATTPAALNTPNAPSNLVLTPVSATRVNLSWTDNSNNETAFRVERKTDVGGTYTFIGEVGANVTSFSDFSTGPNITYFYRVKARNSVGDSAYLAEQSVTTPNLPPGQLKKLVPATW